MAGKEKAPDSVEGRMTQIKRFTYEGVPIYKLTPVTAIKDLREQMVEIENRLVAMAKYCDENGLVMTPLHMKNSLGITSTVYARMLRGKYLPACGGTPISVDRSPSRTDEEVALVKERAALLQQWEEICNQNCLDTVAKDSQFGRSIYLSKAIFHNWDTPQNTAVVSDSIEIVLGKANRVKIRQEQEAKKAKKAKKDEGVW